MRYQGRIIQWDGAKGFGFIEWNGSSDKLFVHVSAFADRSRRPAVGDIVTYEAERDAEGRHRAVKVMYPSSFRQAAAGAVRAPARRHRGGGRPWLRGVALTGMFAGGVLLYSAFGQKGDAGMALSAAPVASRAPAMVFECAGKTRCTEMRSCEEAMFYLQNCPGTLSDGDRDGIPCEDQWCGH